MIRTVMFFLVSTLLLLAGCVLLWLDWRTPRVLFEGEMWLRPGSTETAVLAAHDPARSSRLSPDRSTPRTQGVFRFAQRLDQIPISPAAQALLPTEPVYDVALLPFQIRLREATVLDEGAATDVLVVQRDAHVERLPLVPGASLTVDGEQVEIATIRPWGGLLRDPSGRPMAEVAIRIPGGPLVEDVLLAAEEWVRAGEDLALQFQWMDPREGADAENAPEHLDSRRWGVVEGPAIHWLSSFVPGTSVALRDGRTVALEEIRPGSATTPPALVVRVESGSESNHVEAAANAWDDDALVRYEDWALLANAVVIRASTVGHARLSHYAAGVLADETQLRVGETWTGPDDIALRLDQLEASALPLPTSQSPIKEVELRTSAGDVRIRQGESARWGNVTLAYHRDVSPPKSRIDLTLITDGGEIGAALSPDGHVWWGRWELAQATSGNRAGGYTLSARLHRRSWGIWVGATLIFTGLLTGLLAFGGRRLRALG